MSTSRRGLHVKSLPPEQAAPTVVEDVDGFEGDVLIMKMPNRSSRLVFLRPHVLLRLPPPVRTFQFAFEDLT
jgi:hypothetical protein